MPDVLYVGLQDGNKILTFAIDSGSGKLALEAETSAAGAPSVFAVSPDRRVMYVGYRGTPSIESCRIDSASGALTSLGRVATDHPPTHLAADRAGKYLLSAYYQGGYASVHALGPDGAVRGPYTELDDRIWLVTFIDYDLGYFDDETCRLEPLANPFVPKVLPMSPV